MSTPSLAAHAPLQASARSRLRLTRRGRAVLTTLAAAPIVAGIMLGVLNSGQASAGNSSSHQHFEYVTVEPGGSLWQIAEAEAPHSDPSQFVQDVVTLNDLQSSVVQAGQRIAIPPQYVGSH